MDRIHLNKSYRWPSPIPSQDPPSHHSVTIWDSLPSTPSPSPVKMESQDYSSSSDSGCTDQPSQTMLALNDKTLNTEFGTPIKKETDSETEVQGILPCLPRSKETLTAATDANRLHALSSNYGRVIRKQKAPRSEPRCPTRRRQALPQAVSTYDQSKVAQLRRSQRKRKSVPSPTPTTTSHRAQTKRIATCASDEYEFSRLGGVRQKRNGLIEYEVFWKPSWVTVEDLQGGQALKNARELVVHKFGQGAWEKEMVRSKNIEMDTESAYM